MLIQTTFYLNKITGEVLNSREKEKYDIEVTKDETLFQILKGDMKPVIFVKLDEIGDYEGKIVDLTKLNEAKLAELGKEGYSLSENINTNLDIPRRFKVCQHCLTSLKGSKDITKQVALDDLNNYFELKQSEMKYFTTVNCPNCNNKTKMVNYYENFKHTDELDIQEIVITHSKEVNETEILFQNERIEEILFFKVYDLKKLPDVNDINNYEAIKSLTQFQDYKRIEGIKFRRSSKTYFKSNEICQKYNVRQMV